MPKLFVIHGIGEEATIRVEPRDKWYPSSFHGEARDLAVFLRKTLPISTYEVLIEELVRPRVGFAAVREPEV